jgi:hypothetical protein
LTFIYIRAKRVQSALLKGSRAEQLGEENLVHFRVIELELTSLLRRVFTVRARFMSNEEAKKKKQELLI